MPKRNVTITTSAGSTLEEPDASFSQIEGWLTTARPRLHHLAQLRGIAADAIEDVVQETLLEAWKHQDRLHTPEGFSAWLDEICRNVCRRHARKQWMDQQHIAPLFAPYQYDEGQSGETEASLLMNIPDTRLPDPLDTLSQQDVALLLDRALGSLSRNAREVVELCYLVELPQREVALQLGLSISALEGRLHRARHQLRQLLNGPLHADAEALGLAWTRNALVDGRKRVYGVPSAAGIGLRGCFSRSITEVLICICDVLSVSSAMA
jgi:RNA polymerase sigma factor (sigma-70 family)